MAGCGPFGARPGIAVAVSGGADSLACAWLACRWALTRNGRVDAVVVDHGMRAGSAAEAAWTVAALAEFGVPAESVRLTLDPGRDLSARAREARMAAIEAQCAARGIIHVLLGHHAADQAETVAMRLLRGSGPLGLAAMPTVREGRHVRWLRPLLTVSPGRLRATLRAAGLDWVSDPSNADPLSLRARLRALRLDPDGTAPATLRAVDAAGARGAARAATEVATADWLAQYATSHEAGFVVLRADPPAAALASIVRAVGGRRYPPAAEMIARWCARPRPATLGGVAIGLAGRLGPGWLITREVASMRADAWDGRWRPGRDAMVTGHLPCRVRRTLPPASAIEWVGPAICPAPFASP